MLSLANATAASERSRNRGSHRVHRMLEGSRPLESEATRWTAPSHPGRTGRSPLREARVTRIVPGALSRRGTALPEFASTTTCSAETPGVESAALSAGNRGAGAIDMPTIGLTVALAAGLAITPLIGAAIVARPSALAMPT
jgi:hypothetical protein